jgi:hypothetical protein
MENAEKAQTTVLASEPMPLLQNSSGHYQLTDL